MDKIDPSLEEIEEIARETVANLPPAFRETAQAVALRVADFAPDESLAEREMEPFDRTVSVSSRRRMKVPPFCRAIA